MRIATSKIRQILYLTVIGLVMLAIIAPINAPTSKTVSARTQQPAYVKAGAFTDMETVLSRIVPFYKADSWLNMGRNGLDARFYKADSWLNKGRNGLDARYSLLKLGLANKLIVPVQEPGKTSVLFKGRITKEGLAKEGTVSLVLRIYDQADGGAKLYEGTHEAKVRSGVYFASIQVPSETIANSRTIWLEAASVEEKELAFEPRQPFYIKPKGVNAQTVTAVAFCETCGGNAPWVEGAIYIPTGYYGDHDLLAYGRECSGALEGRFINNYLNLCVGFQF